MNVAEKIQKLYSGTQTPMMAIQKAYMRKTSKMSRSFSHCYMEFTDARECTHEIYQKRGYNPALEFINMLTGYDLITLEDRTNLTTFITMFEEEKIHKKQQKKLDQKIRKNLK